MKFIKIKKAVLFLLLPLFFLGCGVSIRLYQKVANDPAPSLNKLAILAPFVKNYYPTKETFIQGKSDTTLIHDTTTEVAIYYDTITKRFDSIKIKNIFSNRLIMRIDTIKVKETFDCYLINQKFIESELKVKAFKAKEQKIMYFVLFLILLIFIIIWIKFHKNANI